MDKKSIAILLITSSFVTSAFANSLINKIITKHSSATPSIIKTHKMIKRINHTYTDFSGTWIMNCGDGHQISTVIENSADYITLDGDESRIGQGLQGKYESNDDETNYEHTSYEWNADGSALIMQDADVSKDNMNGSEISTYMATFTLTMKNGQINLDGKWVHFKNVTQIKNPVTVHCVLTRKQ